MQHPNTDRGLGMICTGEQLLPRGDSEGPLALQMLVRWERATLGDGQGPAGVLELGKMEVAFPFVCLSSGFYLFTF